MPFPETVEAMIANARSSFDAGAPRTAASRLKAASEEIAEIARERTRKLEEKAKRSEP